MSTLLSEVYTNQNIKELVFQQIKNKHFIHLDADSSFELINNYIDIKKNNIDDFISSWEDLEIDGYMGDGGKYRKRRYSTLSSNVNSGEIKLEKHQPHFQTKHYNDLNGNIERHYQPIKNEIINNEIMMGIFNLSHDLFTRLSPNGDWHIETHQFRIETVENQIGKPTPEGIHRDGVDYVIMLFVNKINCIGGESSLYDNTKNKLTSFTMKDTFEMVILNDKTLFHGVSPIYAISQEEKATRDILVVTFRKK